MEHWHRVDAKNDQSQLRACTPRVDTIWKYLVPTFFKFLGEKKETRNGQFLSWEPTKKGHWALHVYSIATFVASWLKSKWFWLNSNEFYYDKLAKKTRFDHEGTNFIKRLLQVELQEDLRSLITNSLFEKYVGISESSFSRELYLNIDQIVYFGVKFIYMGCCYFWWYHSF